MTQTLRIARSAAALSLIVLLSVVSGAAAVSIESGRTVLRLDRGLLARLEADAIKVKALKPAKLRGPSVALPVGEGLLESRLGTGYLFLRGGIRFSSPNGSVTLGKLVQNTAKKTLRGKLDGAQVTIAATERVRAKASGFDIDLTVGALSLSARAASALNRGLGVKGVFGAGQSLGSSISTTQPESVAIDGGAIEFSLDEGFRQKLQALGVSVLPFEVATQLSSLPLAFRINVFKGEVNSHLARGGLSSNGHGGLRLVQSGSPEAREITWTGLGINFENGFGGPSSDVVIPTWQVPAGISAFGPLGEIDFGTALAYDARKGIASAGPAAATLSPYAVAPLNDAFAGGKAVFAVGEPIGIFSFSAKLRSG